MALISSFLTQSVTIKPYIRDAGGEPIYGIEKRRKCRLQYGSNLRTTYKNPAGQIDQVLANAKMFCEGDIIPEKSVVTYEGREFVVIKCFVMRGFRNHHLEVYLE